jgi:ketosteroid isomerase-like protein
MDLMEIQDLFRATDSGDAERLAQYLHPALVLNMIGVEGTEEPLDLPSYLAFLAEAIRDRESRHEHTEHVPTHVKIEETVIAVRGFLKITLPDEPDQYHPYTDLMRLRDGKIVEYNIAYDI